MKLSDYVADVLARKGVTHAFVITGGASIHLIDSLAGHPDIDYVCCLHEQACAMAADGYSRGGTAMGVAIATSGPGATNLITGICSAYYDSIPLLCITGQVSTFRQKRGTGVRQMGFQETDTVDICRPVTKYAVLLDEPDRIRYELEKCWHIAHEGRPGPVLLDIPDNLQRADVDPAALVPFTVPTAAEAAAPPMDDAVQRCVSLIHAAERPVAIFGQGIHLSGAREECRSLMKTWGAPFALTWAAADLFPSDDHQNAGTFGTHGTRFANFAVQNADLVVAVGTRLDTKATGSPPASFARAAKKIMVDIDPCELAKFRETGLKVDVPIHADALEFVRRLHARLRSQPGKNCERWIARIQRWKEAFPICPDGFRREIRPNPYVFVKELSRSCKDGETVVIDTGCTVAWMMQAFDVKGNQRLLHDWNNTAMGWALPAAIGSSFALKRGRVICVMGDGSLHMNIQELATVVKHRLPIKIFVLNNRGYSMIQQTQDQWLDSRYHASTEGGGLPAPDLRAIARAYGFATFSISGNAEISAVLSQMLSTDGPAFCNVEIDPCHRVIPQVKFGRPNEDSEPLLSREEFLGNMITPPMECSRT